MLVRQFIFAALIVGATEWRVGLMGTALLFFGFDSVSTLLLLGTIAIVPQLGWASDQYDVGMSMGGSGRVDHFVC